MPKVKAKKYIDINSREFERRVSEIALSSIFRNISSSTNKAFQQRILSDITLRAIRKSLLQNTSLRRFLRKYA